MLAMGEGVKTSLLTTFLLAGAAGLAMEQQSFNTSTPIKLLLRLPGSLGCCTRFAHTIDVGDECHFWLHRSSALIILASRMKWL